MDLTYLFFLLLSLLFLFFLLRFFPVISITVQTSFLFSEPNPNAVTLPPSSTSTPSSGGCVDHVINGFTCAGLPSVCADRYGQVFCRKYCGRCGQ